MIKEEAQKKSEHAVLTRAGSVCGQEKTEVKEQSGDLI